MMTYLLFLAAVLLTVLVVVAIAGMVLTLFLLFKEWYE